MRCLRFLLNVVFLCLFLISPAGKADQAPVKNIAAPAAKPAPDGKSKQIKSSSQSPKIHSFLAELERAGSIEDVARVFAQSKFNQGKRSSLQKVKADLKRIQDLKISRHNQRAVEIMAGLKHSSGVRIAASVSSLKVAVRSSPGADIVW